MADGKSETQRGGIREVARLAGVSVASASFALNGQPGVAEQTRRRVLAAAQKLGYRAHPQARALRRGSTTIYGFVVRNFSNPFFLDVLSGAEQVAGLAIAPVGTGDSIRLWQQLRPGAPVVALNASAEGIPGVCRVGPDNAAAVGLPVRRLAGLGHEAIAFLSAPRKLMADPDRLRHFRRMCRESGITARVFYSALTIADVQRSARVLLSGQGAPSAVITNSDYTAHAIYKAARELSLRIGPEISVVGHDDLPTSELLDPVPLDDYVAPVELIERASLRRPRGAGRSRRSGDHARTTR